MSRVRLVAIIGGIVAFGLIFAMDSFVPEAWAPKSAVITCLMVITVLMILTQRIVGK